MSVAIKKEWLNKEVYPANKLSVAKTSLATLYELSQSLPL